MEHLIDIFARDPNSLSVSERDRIDALLDEHPAFRDYLDHLRDFYRSFRELSTEDVPDHVRAFADSLVRLPHRINLRLPAERTTSRSRGPGFRFLRADAATASRLAGSTAPGTLRAAGSLVSTEYGVLLRLIVDPGADELRGYILSPSQEDASRALVRFDVLDLPHAADASGVVRIPLGEIRSVDELLTGDVELMLPMRSVTVRSAGLADGQFSSVLRHDRIDVRAMPVPSGLRFRISGGAADHFVVFQTGRERHVRHLDVTPLDLRVEDAGEDVSIRLYAE